MQRGMHLNDSKVPLNAKKDRHENIGAGYIVEGFRAIMNDPRVAGVPLILETPAPADEKALIPKYAAEIALLYSLQGTAAGDATAAVVASTGGAAAASAPQPKKAAAAKAGKRARPAAAAAAAAADSASAAASDAEPAAAVAAKKATKKRKL